MEGRNRDKVRRIAERHMLRLSRLERIEKELSQLVDESSPKDPGEVRIAHRIKRILDGKP
jgi:16S rRNA U516 pseudouridylate synthase RsuA-like enzyme